MGHTSRESMVGTLVFLGLFFVSILIRAPHQKISRATKTNINCKGTLEKILISLMAVSTPLLPILSLTPILSIANYTSHSANLYAGAVAMFAYIWLFHRSHTDLGKNWSPTLEIREDHSITDHGVYKYIRHPMYASFYLMAIGQALLIPNWIAGPASLIAFTLMFFLRLKPEEQMMVDRFGAKYTDYRAKTKRLIPGIW